MVFRLREPIDLLSPEAEDRLMLQSPKQKELAMLILSRRLGEETVLDTSDGEIEIVLHRVDGQKAKIGIEAPKKVLVLREELVES